MIIRQITNLSSVRKMSPDPPSDPSSYLASYIIGGVAVILGTASFSHCEKPATTLLLTTVAVVFWPISFVVMLIYENLEKRESYRK